MIQNGPGEQNRPLFFFIIFDFDYDNIKFSNHTEGERDKENHLKHPRVSDSLLENWDHEKSIEKINLL